MTRRKQASIVGNWTGATPSMAVSPRSRAGGIAGAGQSRMLIMDVCGAYMRPLGGWFAIGKIVQPLIMINIARTARAHDALYGRRFCVTVLGAEQEQVARHFAGGGTGTPRWADDPAVPRLDGVLAHIVCEPWRAHDGGDHTIFLGEVTGFDYRSGDALAYANSRFTTVPEPVLGHEYLI